MIFLVKGCSKPKSFKVGFLYSTKNKIRFVRESNYFNERVKQLGENLLLLMPMTTKRYRSKEVASCWMKLTIS
jgi:hypothetical protein